MLAQAEQDEGENGDQEGGLLFPSAHKSPSTPVVVPEPERIWRNVTRSRI